MVVERYKTLEFSDEGFKEFLKNNSHSWLQLHDYEETAYIVNLPEFNCKNIKILIDKLRNECVIVQSRYCQYRKSLNEIIFNQRQNGN